MVNYSLFNNHSIEIVQSDLDSRRKVIADKAHEGLQRVVKT